MRILGTSVTVILLVGAVAFALSNDTRLELSLFPLPIVVMAPVYLYVFSCLLIGFCCGGLVAFAAGTGIRRVARERARRLLQLEQELADTKIQLAEAREKQIPLPVMNALDG